VGQGISESIGNIGGKQAVFALLVVDDDGSICMGDEKEGRGGGNPTDCGAE
jgi:hypothetical protein